MRSFAAGLLLFTLPALGQWALPEGLPPLAEGVELCNDTHCLLNKKDFLALKNRTLRCARVERLSGDIR